MSKNLTDIVIMFTLAMVIVTITMGVVSVYYNIKTAIELRKLRAIEKKMR